MATREEGFLRRTMKNSISGTVSGIAGVLVGHPFDTLKVRLQTQPLHNPVYSGVVDCFVKTLKWEGVGGLYKGLGKYEYGLFLAGNNSLARKLNLLLWVLSS